jgi:hypothetical protein
MGWTSVAEALWLPQTVENCLAPAGVSASALVARTYQLSEKNFKPPPQTSTVWSTLPPTLTLSNLYNVGLYSDVFWKKLEDEAHVEITKGAMSLSCVHGSIRLPIWFITFAQRMLMNIKQLIYWSIGHNFIDALEAQDSSNPDMPVLIKAAKELFAVMPCDETLGKHLPATELARFLSQQRVGDNMMDAVMEALTARMVSRSDRFEKVHLSSNATMRYLQMDEAWEDYKKTKGLKLVNAMPIQPGCSLSDYIHT